ncbi:MAG: hypothetical protein U0N82_14230 [Oscillospiraceae bacterium]
MADDRAEGGEALGGIEGKRTHEAWFIIPVIRIQTASGHDGIGGTNHGGFMEGIPDIFFIIIRNIGTVNVAEDVLLVRSPVFSYLPVGNFFDKIRKCGSRTDAKLICQRIGDCRFEFFTELEQIGSAAVGMNAGITNIKHIFDFRVISGGINEGDAPSATLNIPTHLIVPDFIACTGSGIRALGIDHKLLMVRIFIKPSHRAQERSPVLMAQDQFRRGLVRHFTIDLEFG